MLKKTIQYEDLEGNTVRDDFYFHFNQAELAKLKMKYEPHGGMEVYFKKIMKAQDVQAITEAFEEIIVSAIGEKAADGKRFEKKNGDVGRWFKETDAYSVLFMELLSGGGKAFQEFLQNVLPSGLQEKLAANEGLNERVAIATAEILSDDERGLNVEITSNKTVATDLRPAWVQENRDPTREELLAMTPDQFAQWSERR